MTNEQDIRESAAQKEEQLKHLLGAYDSMVLAFSGGVDSTYLAHVAKEMLGERVHLVIADSPSVPREDLRGALTLAESMGWPLEVLRTTEFESDVFLRNDGMRCYHCRIELFGRMRGYAEAHGLSVLAYGANADDADDPTRVGAKAAVECAVAAPLQEVGLRKAEIRVLSKERGLPTATKPAFACLATRVPSGTRLTREALESIEAAETVLREAGFRQYRARHHGDVCRVELEPDDFARMLEPSIRERVVEGIRAIGYRFVALDLAGYRAGSTAARPDGA